jgi:hypothetical protein
LSAVGSTAGSRTQQSTGSGNDSTAANRGSIMSNMFRNSTNTADSVEAARSQTMFALEHGGRALDSERPAQALVSRVAEDPNAAQQLSSSGGNAQRRRRGGNAGSSLVL